MLRRVCLWSLGLTLPSLGFVTFCLIGLSSTWAQSSGSQPVKVTTASAPQIAAPTPAAPATMMRPAVSDDDKSYRIGPGDVLGVQVFNRPELNREVRVNNQGRIPLFLIDEIPAACLTESQLVRVITDKYTKYIRNPQVSVFIKEYNSQLVSVIGAVNKPAQFQLQRRVRLIELLSSVGGPSERAGRKVLLIHSGEQAVCESGELKPVPSAEPAIPVMTELNLRDILNGSPEANLYIQPGDIITVPEADQVFVTGSVNKPSPIPLIGKLTLTRAIYSAGGFYQDANKKRVRVIRQQSGTETMTETFYNVEDIEKHRADDITLQANDVIDVPNSTGKSLGRSLLQIIAPTAGQLPLRIVRPY